MIEQSSFTIGNEERLLLARNAIELASNIYENIDQVSLPGTEISQFDLYRKGPKNQFSGLADFFRNYNQGYDKASIGVPVEKEFIWMLEQTKTSEYKRMPARGYIVKEGLMLSTLGKLIEFRQGKYDNYKILNEQTIKDPMHVINLLGNFANKNSIDYSER